MEKRMSPYNPCLEETVQDIVFCDVTMREGEQAPGVVFSLEEKIRLAHLLDEVGVSQIQLYPGKTKSGRQVVKKIAEQKLNAKIVINSVCFEDTWRDNINYSLECGTDIVHISFCITPYSCPGWKEGMPQRIQERIAEAVTYAKSQCNHPIEVAYVDATRAEKNVLFTLVQTALEAQADRIHLADTAGVASPEAIEEIVRRVVRMADGNAVVGVHCHNDFGLALANCIAAIRAGARLTDVAVNGLGDRAGNVVLAEAAITLEAMYGVKTKIKLDQMKELSRYVSKISARPIPVNQPFVGDHVFVNQDDFHVSQQGEMPFAYRGIRAKDVGGEEKIMFGKVTGPYTIAMMAKRYGRDIPENLYGEICSKLYDLANTHKGLCIDENGFWNIVHAIERAHQSTPQ